MSAPDTSERIRAALDAATPSTDPEVVLRSVSRRVAHRRVRRRRRRIARGSLGVVLAVVVAAAIVREPVLVQTTDQAAAPTGPGNRDISTPTSVDSEMVEVPGSGGRVTLVAADARGAWFTRGEPVSARRSSPDTVSRIESDGTVGPSTQVQGVAAIGDSGPDWLWLLVDEQPTSVQGSWRLKRIDRTDGRLVASHVVDLDGRPSAIEASGDGVSIWDASTIRRVAVDGTLIERVPVGPTTGPPDTSVPPDELVLQGERVEIRRR